MSTPAPFRSVHDAMTFAFRYASQQAPRNPMAQLLAGGRLGSDRGLVGLDGAGQAGMLLAAVGRLPAAQRAAIVVRYGGQPVECACCGSMSPPPEWWLAVDTLSHVPELSDLPRPLRRAAVQKIVARQRVSITAWASKYEHSARTVRSRVAKAKPRLAQIENEAVSWLSDHLEGRAAVSAA